MYVGVKRQVGQGHRSDSYVEPLFSCSWTCINPSAPNMTEDMISQSPNSGTDGIHGHSLLPRFDNAIK